MGQVVVQDGGSTDHGVSGSPSRIFSINSSFQARKWVANHIHNYVGTKGVSQNHLLSLMITRY